MERLSARQLQVLAAIARGHTTKEIGHELGIRERTVKWHVARLMRKLNASGRPELVAIAFERGLLSDVHCDDRASGELASDEPRPVIRGR